jgi:Tfp pilus assembly protein PilP
MKTKLGVGIIVLLLGGSLLAGPQAQDKPNPKAAPTENQAETSPPLSFTVQPKPPQYDPAGRRDPFKDLLGGSQTRERSSAEGPELAIADLNLIGIAKFKGQIYALVSGPQGFPYKIKAGDRFADGYVLKVTEDAVTFRQTMDRGMRLPSPRDIVKEINPEER